MELMVNDRNRFCRIITSFFRPVHSRDLGKLIQSLLYYNFMAFKVQIDGQIYILVHQLTKHKLDRPQPVFGEVAVQSHGKCMQKKLAI